MSNIGRLKNLMNRAQQQESITIGFFGGSITQGSLASVAEKTYAYGVCDWWKQNFPQTEFRYVNAGIGGTTSHYGVARAERDLLVYRPDFVIIDFSVNDDLQEPDFFKETFEGVIRKLYYSETAPALLILNNAFYDTGENLQREHNEIADYYGIEHVSIKDTLYSQITNGLLEKDSLTTDNLHPNDRGHLLIGKEICKVLDEIRQKKDISMEKEEKKPPLTENAYEMTKLLNIMNYAPKLNGFLVDTQEKCGHLDLFKNGWIGRHIGDCIHFELEGSCIAIQYRKTVCHPAPVARLIVDGDKEHPVKLDANFTEDWGDCLYLQPILHHGDKKIHTLDIEIVENGKPQNEFYLVAVLCS